MSINYEWTIEELDGEEIVDCNHADTLAELVTMIPTGDYRIGLVRDFGNEFDGLQSRSWAYITKGELPSCFFDAFDRFEAEVPKRFFKELDRAKALEILPEAAHVS